MHKERLTELRDQDRKFHIHPFTNHLSMHTAGTSIVTWGKGCHVFDESGRRLLDGLAGLWCVNVGYGQTEIIDAVTSQMHRMPFYPSFFNTTTEPPIKLAAKLAELAPPRLNHSMFCESGSEANESAIKIIRAYNKLKGQPEKTKLLSRTFAYHGVGVATTSLTGLPSCYAPFDLPLPGYIHAPGPYPFEAGREKDAEGYGKWCIEETKKLIEAEGAETIAAMFVEPVQGAGGVIIPPAGYLKALRELCKKYDIFYISDEVITGFGRLGMMFASNEWNLDPDIMTLAKGITSGYVPFGAVMVSDQIIETLNDAGYFAHGFTYSGHPVGAAAALANIGLIERENLVERVRDRIGPYFEQKLATLRNHPAVGEVRSCKLIAAIELLPKGGRKELSPTLNLGIKMSELVRKEGLIARGIRNLLAISPAFVITEPEVDFLVGAVRKGLDKLWN